MNNTVCQISKLQCMAAEARSLMLGNLLQLKSVDDTTTPDMTLEIVTSYLQQASEDACSLADLMCCRHASLHQMALLTELSAKSFGEFMRAFNAWRAQCLN